VAATDWSLRAARARLYRCGCRSDHGGYAMSASVKSAMSALGQKQTYAPLKAVSALPPKADIGSAIAHVCFGPKADIATLFNYLIGDLLEVHRNFKAERLSRLEVDCQLEFGGQYDWQV